jgi:hypothetical protein
MEVIKIKDIEDCFDGTYIKELLFDSIITEEFILYLGKHGKLSYFKNFERPFFKIIFRDDFYVKGVQGNETVRILIKSYADIDFFCNLL